MNRKLKIMANLLLTAAFVAVLASCSEDEPVQATGVTLNKSMLTLVVGEEETLKAMVAPGVDMLASFAGSSGSGAAGSLLSIVTYVLLLGIGAGYLLTIIGLGKFGNILDAADRGAILSVRMAFIIALIAAALDVFPFIPDIVGDIVYLVAIILMLLRYGSLKKSATFAGKAGASTLFVAMILLVVRWGLDFIPLVGDWLESLLT
jgi:hypothetical protein